MVWEVVGSDSSPLSLNPRLPICQTEMMVVLAWVGVWGMSLARCRHTVGTQKLWDCNSQHPGAPAQLRRSQAQV